MAIDPPGKDSAVKDLDQLYQQARTGKSFLEPTWLMNLAYYGGGGGQWLAWNGRQLFQPNLRPNRITIEDNRIQGCVRTEIAKMTKNRPMFSVTPTTGDDEDINAANLSEQVMRYLWKHLQAQEIVSKALWWSRITGAGFVKCFWDSTLGDSTEVLVGPSGSPLTDGQGATMRPGQVDPGQMAAGMGLPPEAIRVKTISRGDICLEARSPFQMFVDPLADTFDEAEWVIEESVKSREHVLRRYGVDLEPDTPANPGLVEVKMGSFMPGSSPYKGVKLREYWCKPSSQHPDGCKAVWAQGRILEENPHPFDPLPYVMLSGIPIPGRLWPTSIVEQLRGPQTELNKVKSQLAENRNRVGNPTIIASKQAIQDPEKFASSMTQPGGISWIDDVGSPNAVPKFLEAPQMAEYVVEEIVRIEESIQEISGQHEVTSAQVPPGVTAASAINLLQEADDTRLGPAITDYENQLGKLGQKVLALVANYYTDARAIRIAGDNGAFQVFDFRGSMLRGNTQVEVQAGSAFPQSKAAKQAAMQEWLTYFVQSGHPLDTRQLAQFMQDQDIGGMERLLQQWTVDETQVNRENVLLARGQPLNINPFDNDQTHLAAHEDFQKSQRYAKLPPQLQQLFEAHVDQHRQRLAQQQQAQMQLEAQMQGGGAQNGSQDAQEPQQQASMAPIAAAVGHGFDQAGRQQDQRHAEELHQQKIHQAEEAHRSRMSAQQRQAQREEELHQQKLALQQRQAQQQSQQQRQQARSK